MRDESTLRWKKGLLATCLCFNWLNPELALFLSYFCGAFEMGGHSTHSLSVRPAGAAARGGGDVAWRRGGCAAAVGQGRGADGGGAPEAHGARPPDPMRPLSESDELRLLRTTLPRHTPVSCSRLRALHGVRRGREAPPPHATHAKRETPAVPNVHVARCHGRPRVATRRTAPSPLCGSTRRASAWATSSRV